MQGGQSPEEVKFAYKMMASIMNDCAKDCLNDFSSAQFNGNEQTCITNCAQQSFALTQKLMENVQQQQ